MKNRLKSFKYLMCLYLYWHEFHIYLFIFFGEKGGKVATTRKFNMISTGDKSLGQATNNWIEIIQYGWLLACFLFSSRRHKKWVTTGSNCYYYYYFSCYPPLFLLFLKNRDTIFEQRHSLLLPPCRHAIRRSLNHKAL